MTDAVARSNGSAAPDAAATHPAPERGRASLAALWFGFFGAPAAWSVGVLVNLALASHACFPSVFPLAAPVTGGLRGIALAVSVAAVAVCVAAAMVAWGAWRRTRGEHQESSGRGSEHAAGTALLETGEGRTRFMALAGVLTSVTFLLASIANAAAIVLVTPCIGCRSTLG